MYIRRIVGMAVLAGSVLLAGGIGIIGKLKNIHQPQTQLVTATPPATSTPYATLTSTPSPTEQLTDPRDGCDIYSMFDRMTESGLVYLAVLFKCGGVTYPNLTVAHPYANYPTPSIKIYPAAWAFGINYPYKSQFGIKGVPHPDGFTYYSDPEQDGWDGNEEYLLPPVLTSLSSQTCYSPNTVSCNGNGYIDPIK